jgi:hypothetical protein
VFQTKSTREFPLLPDYLQHLDLRNSYSIQGSVARCENVTSLVSLNLEGCMSLNSGIISALVSSNSDTLRDLRLSNLVFEDTFTLGSLFRNEYPRRLKVLCLSQAFNLEDKDCQKISDLFPELVELDISYTGVTGIGIKALLTSKVGSRLEYLDISSCFNVGSDAIEFARSKVPRFKCYKIS